MYWLHKVNHEIWKFADNKISVADPQIINMINQLDETQEGQKALSIIGKYRSLFGEKTGSVLWADVEEHPLKKVPKTYGLNQVFQVFGHTRLNREYDKLEYEGFAMIDSQRCFMIDEDSNNRIFAL